MTSPNIEPNQGVQTSAMETSASQGKRLSLDQALEFAKKIPTREGAGAFVRGLANLATLPNAAMKGIFGKTPLDVLEKRSVGNVAAATVGAPFSLVGFGLSWVASKISGKDESHEEIYLKSNKLANKEELQGIQTKKARLAKRAKAFEAGGPQNREEAFHRIEVAFQKIKEKIAIEPEFQARIAKAVSNKGESFSELLKRPVNFGEEVGAGAGEAAKIEHNETPEAPVQIKIEDVESFIRKHFQLSTIPNPPGFIERLRRMAAAEKNPTILQIATTLQEEYSKFQKKEATEFTHLFGPQASPQPSAPASANVGEATVDELKNTLKDWEVISRNTKDELEDKLNKKEVTFPCRMLLVSGEGVRWFIAEGYEEGKIKGLLLNGNDWTPNSDVDISTLSRVNFCAP